MSTSKKRIRTVHDRAPFVSSLPPTKAAISTTENMPPLFVLHQQPYSNSCHALMERVVREFLPIIVRRGYTILSVSEFCCCGDGLDNVQLYRKKRIQSNNVLGYNQTVTRNGRKSHEIHLRMRPVNNHHCLYDYEDIAGTMAHELAHCERGPHDKPFFEIMEGILDEHAALLASRLTTFRGLQPMLPFMGSGQRLGGAVAKPVSRLVGHKLGGDCCFQKFMTPSEAAVAAAQGRQRQLVRLRGNQCCQPCVIDLCDDEKDTKERVPKKEKKRTPCIVDLTKNEPVQVRRPVSDWNCRRCTYLNPPVAHYCGICEAIRA